MFTKYKLFLRWWLFIMLISVGVFICWNLGLFDEMWKKDVTKISFIILAIFSYMSAWCGIKTWRLSALSVNIRNKTSNRKRSKRIKELSKIGWFTSDIFLTLGMIGTLIGFIVMFRDAFSALDLSNVKSAQSVIGNVAIGMSTALYTTLVGLVASLLLKIQYFNLELGLRESKNE